MKTKELLIKHEPKILDDFVGVSHLKLSDDVRVAVATEEVGVLPHDIADMSIIVIDRKASYKKVDYIVIEDERNEKDGYRITKAMKDKEDDYLGRLMLSMKIY